MTHNKRRKNSRHRGSHTHGWGAMKKHRGSGNRGGAGRASSGKRSDSRKPSIWKDTYFGKYGFTSRGVYKKIRPVNISFIEENLDKLVLKKLAKKDGSTYLINLSDLGFNKLLGKGKAKTKLNITADYASSKAVASVKSANGTVTLKKAGEASDGS